MNVPVAETTADFADILRDAIERRGLGLERLRDHLEQRGVSVSVATLSYWQSGRSRPERKSSLAALPHLERLLELPDGSLHAPLATPVARRRKMPVQGLDSVWPETPQARVLHQLDTSWDVELDRISVHDRLEIGPDRRQLSLVVRQVLRARVDGPDRRVVMHCHDDLDSALPEIRPVRGCTLGRTARDAAGGVVGAELVFLRPLRRGQTVVTEYEVVAADPGPYELAYTRRLRLPATEYLLEVQFDPAALPISCEAITGDETTVPLELDPAHSVHVVGTDCTAGTAGIRWTWPDGPEPSPRSCGPHGCVVPGTD